MTKLRSRMRKADDPTDRERIALAIGELTDRGYITFPPWSVCCTNCGWAEIARMVGISEDDDDLPDDLKTVWWHEQCDSYAFAEDSGAMLQTEAFIEKMMEHDEDDEEWFEAHADEAEADSILARMTEYAMLRAPLFLHWRGSKDEITAALRAQGLRVKVPIHERQCFMILPEHSTFSARPENGEIVLTLDGDDVQLTTADARKLVRKLNRAARLAEGQMPSL